MARNLPSVGEFRPWRRGLLALDLHRPIRLGLRFDAEDRAMIEHQDGFSASRPSAPRRAAQLAFVALLAIAAAVCGAPQTSPDRAAPEDHEIEAVGNIERAAKSFLHRQLGADPGSKVEVTVDSVDPRLRFRRCDQDLLASLAPGARPEGNTSVRIACEGPVRWSLFVSGRVERFGQVVVVARPISRGDMILPADVKLERRTTSTLHRGYFDDLADVVGLQSTRSLRPGEVMTDAQLKTPLWVERGQVVHLMSETGGIRVSVLGEALEDGSAGDRVRVRNSSSQRELEGIVEAPGLIRIPM